MASADASPWLASPLAAHVALVLALWGGASRLLGWPLAASAAALYLCWVESGLRRRALRDARREWEAERAARGASEPDAGESLEWLNALLASLWPRCVAPLLCRLAVHRVNARLAAAARPGWLRELRVARLCLGASPPRLSAARVRSNDDGGAAPELTLRLDYAAGRDLRLQLEAVAHPAALRVQLHATKLRLAGTLRLRLAGLSPAFPWVSTLRCAFVEVPELELAVTPLATPGANATPLGTLPGVSHWLEGFARAALAAHAVEPVAKPLRLSARVGDAAPKGRLTLAVHGARGLPALPGADPFVRCALHNGAAETGARRRGRDPHFDGQTLSFDVLSWDRARLKLDVLGWRPRGPPVHLAAAVLDLRAARVNEGLADDGAPCALTLRLAAPSGGGPGTAQWLPGAGGELDVVLSLTDYTRDAAPEPPPELPPAAAHDGSAAALLAAPPARVRAPDAALLPLATRDGAPVPAAQLERETAEAAAQAQAAAAAAALQAEAAAAAELAAELAAASAAAAEPADVAAAADAADVATAPEAAATALSELAPDEPPPVPPADDDVATIEAIPEADAPPPPPAPPLPPAPSAGAAAAAALSPFALSLAAPQPAAPACVAAVEVTVHRADALVASVESDPYVRVTLGRAFAETGVRRRMVDPNFNDQRFVLRCRSWRRADCSLRVAALGWLRAGDPVRLGETTLQLRAALLDGTLPLDGTPTRLQLRLQGVPHGEVSLTLAVRDMALPVPTEEPPEEEEEAAAVVVVEEAPNKASSSSADAAATAAAAAADADGFTAIVLDTPDWLVLLDADADAAAAAAPPAPPASVVARRASAPASQL